MVGLAFLQAYMSHNSEINKPYPIEAEPRDAIESPTEPGVYWFQSETASRVLMVEVRVTNGQLKHGGPTKTNQLQS